MIYYKSQFAWFSYIVFIFVGPPWTLRFPFALVSVYVYRTEPIGHMNLYPVLFWNTERFEVSPSEKEVNIETSLTKGS